MDQKKIRKSLNIFKKRVEEKYKPEKIILFGSYARGKADEYSDVDLVVISSKFAAIPKSKRLDRLYDLYKDLYPDFHVFGLTEKEFEKISPLTSLYEARINGAVI